MLLLTSVPNAAHIFQVWIDPLTKKKFMSENTYLAYTRSKKYTDMVKKSGQPAPEPVIITKPVEQPQQAQQPQQPQQQDQGEASASGCRVKGRLCCRRRCSGSGFKRLGTTIRLFAAPDQAPQCSCRAFCTVNGPKSLV